MLRALDLQQSLHGSGQSSVDLSIRETIAGVVPAPGIPFYSPRLLLSGDRVADRITPLPHKSSLEFQGSTNMFLHMAKGFLWMWIYEGLWNGEIILDYLGGSSLILWVLKKVKTEEEGRETQYEKDPTCCHWFKDRGLRLVWRRGQKSRDMGNL